MMMTGEIKVTNVIDADEHALVRESEYDLITRIAILERQIKDIHAVIPQFQLKEATV